MNNRLLEFIKSQDLTLGGFAESIGVQSSSISHIISGRNKPSFDFIEKLLSKYHQLNPRWFILGEGPMYVSKQEPSEQYNLFNKSEIKKNEGESDDKLTSKQTTEIDRIIIFYSNGKFKEFIGQ